MKKSEALKTLGLQEGASEDDIKKAHRKLIIANHPDKFGQDEAARAKAEEKTKLINEARDVLLNHSWDPEYTTSGTPYGAPFSYNPYTATRPQGGQAGQGTPFEGWPFSETFVWTTWDENGNKTTYTSTGGNPFAGSPFWRQPVFVGRSVPHGRLCWLSRRATPLPIPQMVGNAGASETVLGRRRRSQNPYAGQNPFAGTVFDFSSFLPRRAYGRKSCCMKPRPTCGLTAS